MDRHGAHCSVRNLHCFFVASNHEYVANWVKLVETEPGLKEYERIPDFIRTTVHRVSG